MSVPVHPPDPITSPTASSSPSCTAVPCERADCVIPMAGSSDDPNPIKSMTNTRRKRYFLSICLLLFIYIISIISINTRTSTSFPKDVVLEKMMCRDQMSEKKGRNIVVFT
ncbi:MAG: hypothetical protein BWY45_02703 [Euryarchaeota archaeon ADurb.Bin294]|nr:MAG: hypothetical protein BWY45_02703 [Euryarchaeota archaeon ADurb.Bin294]